MTSSLGEDGDHAFFPAGARAAGAVIPVTPPSPPDGVEKWCHDYFLNCCALRAADVIRAELLEIVKRIELPCAEPAFGSKENALNIKKALLSGYFMQARTGKAVRGGLPKASRFQDSLLGICHLGRFPY